MIQVPAEVSGLAQSVIVQIGAAVALIMPGGAITWKILRNGRHGSAAHRDALALQVARIEAELGALSRRQTETAEQSAKAIADLRLEMREDLKAVRQEITSGLEAVRASVSRVHERVDELLRERRG